MTKREKMIEKLTLFENARLKLLTDEVLKEKTAVMLDCTYCPVVGTKYCKNYLDCVDSINTWYKEGE